MYTIGVWKVCFVLFTMICKQMCYQESQNQVNWSYRLQGKPYAGLVEVYSNGSSIRQWLPLCYNGDDYAASVCIALNFTDPAHQGQNERNNKFLL